MSEISLRAFKRAHLFSKYVFRPILLSPFREDHHLLQTRVSSEVITDFKKSESIWNRNKNSPINYSLVKHLNDCFQRNDELIDYSVDLLKCVSGRRSCSYTFVFAIVKALGDYIQDKGIDFSPTLAQKCEALCSVLHYKHYQLIYLTCSVFKIRDQAKSFKEFIENLIEDRKFIEAVYCITALHLLQEFDLEKVLVPLLFEGKVQPAAICLNNNPDVQVRIVNLLDKYLTKDISNTYPYVSKKFIFKTLTKLLNMYKIPLIHCPNLHLFRRKGAINILINRKLEQSVSEETWEDMIKSVVGDDSDLQICLIQKLVLKNDLKAALKMAKVYNIDEPGLFQLRSENYPAESPSDALEMEHEDIDIASDVHYIENELKPNLHLQYPLNFDSIKIVSDKQTYIKSVNEISKNYSMIGIDSEWKPHFGLSRERLSLIQLAGHDKVFIFDVLSLNNCLNPEDWDLLLDHVFGNSNVMKLGCGIVADINMILESIKGSVGKTIKFSHMLDMALFYQKLQEVYPDKMKDEKGNNNVKGLSFLCEIVLGKPLNKEERLCNWEQRPLKESQLEYAALDAYCLLQMYDKLREECLQEGINFDHIARVAIVLTNKQWKPKRKFKGSKTDKGFQVHSALPIELFKAAVDPIFEGQARELRKLGADVVLLDPGDLVNSAIKLSKSEGRLIICTKSLSNQVKDSIKEGLVHMFQPTVENPLSVSHFLQYFNIQVSAKNIYTRCMICNNNSGMKLNSNDLQKLLELQKSDTASINASVLNSLSCFSSEFQTFIPDILGSNVIIKFATPVQTISLNDCAFFCKNCGSIC